MVDLEQIAPVLMVCSRWMTIQRLETADSRPP